MVLYLRSVQKEIRWAVAAGKQIIVLFEKESHRPGFFDYGARLSRTAKNPPHLGPRRPVRGEMSARARRASP